VPTPTEPTAPTPAEPTIPLPPETAPAPSSGGDAAGAFAQVDDTSGIGSAEMDADNAVEQDVIDSVDPGGRPD
jgi:2-oxoglutarate dehydrogenase E1 component